MQELQRRHQEAEADMQLVPRLLKVFRKCSVTDSYPKLQEAVRTDPADPAVGPDTRPGRGRTAAAGHRQRKRGGKEGSEAAVRGSC